MSLLPDGLKTKRGALIAGAGVVVVAVIAFVLVYFVLFPTSSPDKFAVTTPAPSTSTGAADTTGTTASSTGVAGTWKVGTGSKAGYRVREKLAFLPAKSDAVGRTSAITGQATFTDAGGATKATAASFTIDVSQLKSDEQMRDNRIRTIGLESDKYPKATFVLTSPVTIPANSSGKVVKVSATGNLTIHGTTKKVTIPLQMSVTDSAVQAVGSITFPWSEFGMTAPSVGGFVNVEDTATMEFDLHLVHT